MISDSELPFVVEIAQQLLVQAQTQAQNVKPNFFRNVDIPNVKRPIQISPSQVCDDENCLTFRII